MKETEQMLLVARSYIERLSLWSKNSRLTSYLKLQGSLAVYHVINEMIESIRGEINYNHPDIFLQLCKICKRRTTSIAKHMNNYSLQQRPEIALQILIASECLHYYDLLLRTRDPRMMIQWMNNHKNLVLRYWAFIYLLQRYLPNMPEEFLLFWEKPLKVLVGGRRG